MILTHVVAILIFINAILYLFLRKLYINNLSKQLYYNYNYIPEPLTSVVRVIQLK